MPTLILQIVATFIVMAGYAFGVAFVHVEADDYPPFYIAGTLCVLAVLAAIWRVF